MYHNHPRGRPPSSSDVGLMLQKSGHQVGVITPAGEEYRISLVGDEVSEKIGKRRASQASTWFAEGSRNTRAQIEKDAKKNNWSKNKKEQEWLKRIWPFVEDKIPWIKYEVL